MIDSINLAKSKKSYKQTGVEPFFIDNKSENIKPLQHKIIGDSGASGNYFNITDIKLLKGVYKHNDDNKITVTLPNGNKITSTHIGYLNIKNLSKIARKVHLFPNLKGSLLSFGQICDDNCQVVLDNISAKVLKNNAIILTGTRSSSNGLWYMNLNDNNISPSIKINDQNINTVISKNSDTILPSSTNMSETVSSRSVNFTSSKHFIPKIISKSIKNMYAYFHAAMGCPPLTSFINALKRKYIIFPNIIHKNVNKYLSDIPETSKGHMKRINSNIDSTKIISQNPQYDFDDNNPIIVLNKSKKSNVIVSEQQRKGRLYIDASGPFQYDDNTSESDLIFYHEDSNFCLVLPLPDTSNVSYKSTIQEALDYFSVRKMSINICRLDNQCSKLIGNLITVTNQKDIELVPPYNHRANQAERALGSWKWHKTSIMAKFPPNCPIIVLKHIYFQSVLTFNLLRPSAISKNISAWQQVNGAYDYFHNPIAPLGTQVEVYKSKEERTSTWDFHSYQGFYVGPAPLLPYLFPAN